MRDEDTGEPYHDRGGTLTKARGCSTVEEVPSHVCSSSSVLRCCSFYACGANGIAPHVGQIDAIDHDPDHVGQIR